MIPTEMANKRMIVVFSLVFLIRMDCCRCLRQLKPGQWDSPLLKGFEGNGEDAFNGLGQNVHDPRRAPNGRTDSGKARSWAFGSCIDGGFGSAADHQGRLTRILLRIEWR